MTCNKKIAVAAIVLLIKKNRNKQRINKKKRSVCGLESGY